MKKMTTEQWLTETTRLLKKWYGLDPNDCDLDMDVAEDAIRAHESPTDWLEWLGNKRDLDRIDKFY